MKRTITQEFIEQAIFRIEENPPRIKNCFDRLSEEQIWQQANASSNSLGNLVLHLCGNITQYILSALGNKEDLRERDLEFSTKGGFTKEALLKKINQVIVESVEVIRNCDEEKLMKNYTVQGFNFSGIGIIIHVAEHLSYHTGQIAFWTKCIKDQDLGFYANLDLNIKNE